VFRSLRFRLPALFLVAIALTGVVASLIAVRLFQDYTRARALNELRQEARGIAQLLADKAGDLPISGKRLEETTGDRLFYVGLPLFPGTEPQLTPVPRRLVPPAALEQRRVTFDLPWKGRTLLAVSHPVTIQNRNFGALVVARPKAELRQRWVTLFQRLALAFLGGLVVAGGLGWYLSQRITKPVLALSHAADEVATGHYDVDVPTVPARDEIGHLAERFAEMATRLREAEELERNFLMTVSHELRTPLTAIRGHVEALREGVVEDPELRTASLDVISAEATRLERLVGDVLDLAKLDTRRFTVRHEEVDMARLLEQAYLAFGEEAKQRRIDYSRDVSAEPVIVTDGDRVLQIITNLIANAFRWTPNGGSVGLQLSAENGQIHVAVEDTGPGIGPDEQERIFRPFWTHDGKGTGLGLAIARELAMALGGRIDLDSEVGRGSKFELVLPTQPQLLG